MCTTECKTLHWCIGTVMQIEGKNQPEVGSWFNLFLFCCYKRKFLVFAHMQTNPKYFLMFTQACQKLQHMGNFK